MKTIKQQIIDYLEKTGLKPYQLADLAKVPRPTVYRFIKGEREMYASTIDKLMKIINK
jgi:plasmid maintenance system antidote protein VapI